MSSMDVSPEARLAALAVGHACGYDCQPPWMVPAKAAEVPKAAAAKEHGQLQVEITKVGAEYGGMHAMEKVIEGASGMGIVGVGVGVVAVGAAAVGAACVYDRKTAASVGVKAAAGASKPVCKEGLVHASGVAATAALQAGIVPGAGGATALAAANGADDAAEAAGTGAEGAAEGAGAAAAEATGASTAADTTEAAATATEVSSATGAADGAAVAEAAGVGTAETASAEVGSAADVAGPTATEAADSAATGASATVDAAGASAAETTVDTAGAATAEAANSTGSLLDDPALLPAALAVAAVATVGCVVAYPIYFEGTARDCALTPGPIYKGSVEPTELGQTKFLLLTEEGPWNVRWYAYKDERTAMLAATSLYCSRILFDVSRFGHFEEVSSWGAARPHPTIRKGLEKMKEIAKKHLAGSSLGEVSDKNLQSTEPRKVLDEAVDEEPEGESTTASGESADEEASAPSTPTCQAEWMWGDAGIGGWAQKNPLRWSSRRDLKETIKELRQHLHSSCSDRPVLAKVYKSSCGISQETTLTAKTVAEAIASLYAQAQLTR